MLNHSPHLVRNVCIFTLCAVHLAIRPQEKEVGSTTHTIKVCVSLHTPTREGLMHPKTKGQRTSFMRWESMH